MEEKYGIIVYDSWITALMLEIGDDRPNCCIMAILCGINLFLYFGHVFYIVGYSHQEWETYEGIGTN